MPKDTLEKISDSVVHEKSTVELINAIDVNEVRKKLPELKDRKEKLGAQIERFEAILAVAEKQS